MRVRAHARSRLEPHAPLAPPQAAAYGAASTLERHHAAVALRLLAAPAAAGVLAGLSSPSRARVLDLVPALIAATDVERHAAYMDAFAASVSVGTPGPEAAADDVARRDALACMLLKAADVSNIAKPWPLALRWAGLLKAEHLLLGARRAPRAPAAGRHALAWRMSDACRAPCLCRPRPC